MRVRLAVTSCAVLAAVCAFAETPEPPLKTLRVNGVDLAYVDQGRGAPVVLIHGALWDYRAWSAQWPELSKRHRVIAYSRRYHYPNPRPGTAADYSVSAHVADLVGLVTALKIRPAHLVGHSAGAGIAARVAQSHPGLVRRVVLGEPGMPAILRRHVEASLLPSPGPTAGQAREAFLKGDVEGALRLVVENVTGRAAAYDEMPEDRRRILLENLPRQMGAEESTPPDRPLGRESTFTCEDARAIQAPTLLLRGERTQRRFQLVIEELQKCLPSAQRAVLPGSTHGLQLDNPAGFNEIVLAFLARQSTK